MKVINVKKLERQWIGIKKWVVNKGKGTFEWVTAMGKTYAAILICKELVKKPGTENRRVIVIVPKISLKTQWEKEIEIHNIKNARVLVINTVVINDIKYDADLLILDEIHRYASEEFKKLFDLISYKYILGLTATLNRLDGKHDLLEEKAPVVDRITQEEAKREGYVSEFIEYNLGIELSPNDRINYDKINQEFHKFFAIFGHDFDLAMSCMTKQGAEVYGQRVCKDPKQIQFQAVRFNRVMRDRKEYLYKAESKLNLGVEIIRRLKLKTVTFSESTEFANKLTEYLGDQAVCYHSNLETQIRTINGKSKKFGKKRLKDEAIKKFSDNRFKVNVINTAKALDEGFNVEDIELAIIFSSTTNPTQHIQRVGRAIRKYIYKTGEHKVAIIINIYIKNSQDEKWLKARQTDVKTKLPLNPDVIWIEDINEINYGEQSDISESRAFSVITE